MEEIREDFLEEEDLHEIVQDRSRSGMCIAKSKAKPGMVTGVELCPCPAWADSTSGSTRLGVCSL